MSPGRAALGWALVVLTADQLSKLLATSAPGAGPGAVVDPQRNPDLSLGIIGVAPLVAVALTVGVVAAVAGYGLGRVARGELAPWGLGLVLGGASANLVDRVLAGGVQDFIVVGPVVANLADIAVLAGVITMVLAHVAHRPALDRGTPAPTTR